MAMGGVAKRTAPRHVWHLKYAFMQEFDAESESESESASKSNLKTRVKLGKGGTHTGLCNMLNHSENVVIISEC